MQRTGTWWTDPSGRVVAITATRRGTQNVANELGITPPT
jgi:hypothetical protein